MSPTCLVWIFLPLNRRVAAFALILLWYAAASLALAQSITQAPPSQPPQSAQPQSAQPQITKSPEGKAEEAARAAARAKAHHFDRVLIIVLENVDYEVASKDKNLAELATRGASFTNFHALFHPSYPNYLAMVAGTDFGIHRRGRLFADNQVNLPADLSHLTSAVVLIAAQLDF